MSGGTQLCHALQKVALLHRLKNVNPPVIDTTFRLLYQTTVLVLHLFNAKLVILQQTSPHKIRYYIRSKLLLSLRLRKDNALVAHPSLVLVYSQLKAKLHPQTLGVFYYRVK